MRESTNANRIEHDNAFQQQNVALRIIKMRLVRLTLGLNTKSKRFLPELFFREDITGFRKDCTMKDVTVCHEGNEKSHST